MEAHLLKYFGVKGPAPWSIREPTEWIRGPSVCSLRKSKRKRKDWTITGSLWSGNWHHRLDSLGHQKAPAQSHPPTAGLRPTVNSHLGLWISYLQRANPLSPQNNAVPHPHVIKLHTGSSLLREKCHKLWRLLAQKFLFPPSDLQSFSEIQSFGVISSVPIYKHGFHYSCTFWGRLQLRTEAGHVVRLNTRQTKARPLWQPDWETEPHSAAIWPGGQDWSMTASFPDFVPFLILGQPKKGQYAPKVTL